MDALPSPATPAVVVPPCCSASDCCAAASARAAPGLDRAVLIREAFRLEWLTIGWMVIEAAVAIGAGVIAGSLVLLAFGLDSVIELLSAGVLVWRLSVELRRGQAFSEGAERIASRIGGGLLFALAAYVVVSAGWSLWNRHGEEFSVAGLVLCLLAIPIMRYLASRKIAVADQLGSRAMRADAMESITCGWLSLVVVASLAAQVLLGAWWVDPVGSLAIVWVLVKEGREAWNNEACSC
jgi:divalent metal cation (Fe/Co/Zn/Cd) transporter